jgi:hypothetical protein
MKPRKMPVAGRGWPGWLRPRRPALFREPVLRGMSAAETHAGERVDG